jgi:hypothetical protein
MERDMSEQMITEAPRAVTEAERPFWATVARLYREYGMEATDMGIAGTYGMRDSDKTVDVVRSGEDQYRFAGPTVISDSYTCNAAHIRKLVDMGILTPVPESTPHYHVVEFINGCLNDYDSGPIATIQDAREELAQMRDFVAGEYVPAGDDRYERGVHILKIEMCTEACDPDAEY